MGYIISVLRFSLDFKNRKGGFYEFGKNLCKVWKTIFRKIPYVFCSIQFYFHVMRLLMLPPLKSFALKPIFTQI